MRKFRVLLVKELRELVTLQMLLPFAIVIVMFMLLGNLLGSAGESQNGDLPIAVVDLDGSASSQLVIDALDKAGFAPDVVEGQDAEQIALSLPRSEGNIAVSIPEGFGEGLSSYEPQKIETWTVIRSFSFLGTQDAARLETVLSTVNQVVATQVSRSAAPEVPVEMLQNPVRVAEGVVVGDESARTPADEVLGFVGQQTTFIPIVLFIVIIFAAQMIAAAIASEKENKTLETLLSYPIRRSTLVTAKMVAAGLVALLSAGAYMLGMRAYMQGMTEGLGEGAGPAVIAAQKASEAAMRQLGLTFGPGDYALLGLTLFAGILVALSIAIILGAFAESVKSVQALLTPLMVLLLIPYFLTLFLDLSTVAPWIRVLVMAIPFTYPFLAAPQLFLGQYSAVWFGIAYQLVWFTVFVLIAARIFSSDRILTMKLSFGKLRRTKSPATG